MQLHTIKIIAAGGWLAVVCSAALAGAVRSPEGWALLAGAALLPLLGVFWLWNTPRESMSESIQKALR
jgi:hypothetical protein